MLKIRLLQAVCTIAMLGAVPAFAQSNTQGSTAAPAAQQAMPGNTSTSASDSKTGAASSDKDGLGVSSHGHAMHRSAMTHRDRAMHASSKTDTSQDSTIDQLNNQSYQAAQKGQGFAGNGSSADNGSSGMSGNMSGGGMSGNGSAGNGMSGSGAANGSMSGGGMSGSGAAGSGTGAK